LDCGGCPYPFLAAVSRDLQSASVRPNSGLAFAPCSERMMRRGSRPLNIRPAAFRQAAERCARHHLRCWRGVSAAYPRRC
jgi:hypothetical protein